MLACAGEPQKVTRRERALHFSRTTGLPRVGISIDPWGNRNTQESLLLRRYPNALPLTLPSVRSAPSVTPHQPSGSRRIRSRSFLKRRWPKSRRCSDAAHWVGTWECISAPTAGWPSRRARHSNLDGYVLGFGHVRQLGCHLHCAIYDRPYHRHQLKIWLRLSPEPSSLGPVSS